jgi:multidrug efflux pump subunit AcrA (membrane-fusion protein)
MMIGLIGCAKDSSEESSPVVRVDVKTEIVRAGNLDETVTATGSTMMRKETQLRSPITGVLIEFKFFNGDHVTKSEPIALVRTKESEASLQGAEELLRSAKTTAQREEAEQAIALAQKSANTITIRAPFDGIISNKTKSEMEVVAEGDQIAALVDPSSVIFLADIPSSSITKIRQDAQVQLRFMTKPGKTFRGAVHRIEPQVNPNDQTARVQIVFSDVHPELEGSLFGEASIIVGRREHVLLVPGSALLRDDENNLTSLMLVESDSVAYKVNVNVGLRRDSVVEVSSPFISPGSIVVTRGHYGLPDSIKVRVIK